MPDHPALLAFLDVISQRVRHHHNAIWEEEKHYSWWVYTILAGLIWVYSNHGIAPLGRFTIILFGSCFGIWLCISGWRAIHLESKYFYEALELQRRTIKSLGLEANFPSLPDNKLLVEETEYSEMKSVHMDANRFDLSIRSVFKYNLIIVMFGFVTFGFLSIFTLIGPHLR
jgi:hypothetical protein